MWILHLLMDRIGGEKLTWNLSELNIVKVFSCRGNESILKVKYDQ